MSELRAFREGLGLAEDANMRPFVCTGSPLACRSFIVGLNAATPLPHPFRTYWNDDTGFDRARFDIDYQKARTEAGKSGRGNRRVIEAISCAIAPCLETNVYAVPTATARELTPDQRKVPIVDYLLAAIRPALVFAHSKPALDHFMRLTGCREITLEPRRVHAHGHEFWLCGRPGPLYTLSSACADALGAELATYLNGQEKSPEAQPPGFDPNR